MKILCDQCKKFLFEWEETKSMGTAGAEAQRLGFVFKMPFLFTDKYTTLFFCSKECSRKFYKDNIPVSPEATKELLAFKKDIPKLSKDVANKLDMLSKIIKRIKK
jgi:hypothetical protein